MSGIQPAFISPAASVLCACLGFLLVLGTAFFGVVFRKYLRMIVRIMEDRAPDYENGTLTPGINRSNHRELIRFEAEDGQELYGFFASSGQARQPRGVVVFAHEFGSSAESCFRYCKPLIEGGFDVFSFDFRGHGHSPSQCGYKPMQWPTGREKSDMAAAIIRKGSPIPLQHSTPTPAPAYAPVYSPSVADRSG